MRSVQATLAALILFVTGSAAFAQGAGLEWDILTREALSLHECGEYDRAVVLAKKALEVAETNVGPDHPDVAPA